MTIIVFTSANDYFVKYHYLIGKKLEKKGICVIYVTYSKVGYNWLKERSANVLYIPGFEISNYYSLVLSQYELKYNFKKEDLLFEDTDMSVRNDAYKLMARDFQFWETLVKICKPDVIIGSAERYIGRIPQLVCKTRNVKYYWWTRAPYDNMFVMTENAKEGTWSRLIDYWSKNKNKKLKPSEKRLASKLVNKITKEKKNLYLVVGKPKLEVKLFFERLYLNIFVEQFRNPYARLFHFAKQGILKIIRSYLAQRIYHQIDPNLNYYYYPLHLPDDAQILLRAPKFQDQYKLIVEIAKKIPSYCTLVVKEHPNNLGGTPLKILNKIASIPNVMLVHPNVSSHDIIKSSVGIITINSTVGWEALLYGKPVVQLAHSFYECSGLTTRTDLNGLKKAIDKADYPNREDVLRFAHAIFKTSLPGKYNFYYQFARENMNEKNISNIANSIYEVIKNG